MSILGRIKGMFSKTPPAASGGVMQKHQRPQATGVAVDDFSRFQAAETTRLNRAHWARAQGQSINQDMKAWLTRLQYRCSYEYSSNPLFEGVCNTFANDVVGRDGPILQVESDDENFNETVEAAWAEVWDDPEPRHRQSGADVAQGWVKGLLTAGSYFNVLSTVDRPGALSSFGWQSVHARRMITPPKYAGNILVEFGIRHEERTGRPIRYYIDKHLGKWAHPIKGMEFHSYAPAQVNHVFRAAEPEQITGYPWMTSALDTAQQLRDYDLTVIEAAKTHAALTPGLQATHPELVTGVEAIADGCVPMERGQANIAPPGYAWTALDSTQPSAEYKEFVGMKAAEIGRPIHMPKMVVLLSVGDANFSSAQYEGGVYTDGVKAVQGMIERRSLRPFVANVITELTLKGMVNPPRRYVITFTWNVPPNANFAQHVQAIVNLVRNGLISPAQATGYLGHDWEKVMASRIKCESDLESGGLPATPVDGATGTTEPAEPADPNAQPTGNGENNGSTNGNSRAFERIGS